MLSSEAYQALLPFRSGSMHREEGATDIIKYLVGQGYLKETKADVVGELQIRTVEWEITPEGLNALSAYEDAAQQIAAQHAEDEKRYAAEQQAQQEQLAIAEKTYKATVVQAVIAAVSFLAGLLVEHWTGLTGWFLALFG